MIAIATPCASCGTLPAESLVFAPVHCDECGLNRSHILPAELEPLLVDGSLPCPQCGGLLTFVGSAGLAEAVSW